MTGVPPHAPWSRPLPPAAALSSARARQLAFRHAPLPAPSYRTTALYTRHPRALLARAHGGLASVPCPRLAIASPRPTASCYGRCRSRSPPWPSPAPAPWPHARIDRAPPDPRGQATGWPSLHCRTPRASPFAPCSSRSGHPRLLCTWLASTLPAICACLDVPPPVLVPHLRRCCWTAPWEPAAAPMASPDPRAWARPSRVRPCRPRPLRPLGRAPAHP